MQDTFNRVYGNVSRLLKTHVEEYQQIIYEHSRAKWFLSNELKFDKTLVPMEYSITESAYESASKIINKIHDTLVSEKEPNKMTNKQISKWKEEAETLFISIVFMEIKDKLKMCFDIEDKFLWILLCNSSHDYPQVVKVILPMIKNNKMFNSFDGNSYNCLMHALVNHDSLKIMLNYEPIKITLFDLNSKKFNALDLMMALKILQPLLQKNILNIDDVINYNKNEANILHLAVFCNDSNLINYLLNYYEKSVLLLFQNDPCKYKPLNLSISMYDKLDLFESVISNKIFDNEKVLEESFFIDYSNKLPRFTNIVKNIIAKKLSLQFWKKYFHIIHNYLIGNNFKQIVIFFNTYHIYFELLFYKNNALSSIFSLMLQLLGSTATITLLKKIDNFTEKCINNIYAIDSIAENYSKYLPVIHSELTSNKKYTYDNLKNFILAISEVNSEETHNIILNHMKNDINNDFLNLLDNDSKSNLGILKYILTSKVLTNIFIQKYGKYNLHNKLLNLSELNLNNFDSNESHQVFEILCQENILPINFFRKNNYDLLYKSLLTNNGIASFIINNCSKYIHDEDIITIRNKLLTLLQLFTDENFKLIIESKTLFSQESLLLIDKNGNTILHLLDINKFKIFTEVFKNTSIIKTIFNEDNDLLFKKTKQKDMIFVKHLLSLEDLPQFSYYRSFKYYLESDIFINSPNCLTYFIKNPLFTADFLSHETSSGLPLIIHIALNNTLLFNEILDKCTDNINYRKHLFVKSSSNMNILQYMYMNNCITYKFYNNLFITKEVLLEKSQNNNSFFEMLPELKNMDLLMFILTNYSTSDLLTTKAELTKIIYGDNNSIHKKYKFKNLDETFTIMHKLILLNHGTYLINLLNDKNLIELLFINSNIVLSPNDYGKYNNLTDDSNNLLQNSETIIFDSPIQLLSVINPKLISNNIEFFKDIPFEKFLIKNIYGKTILENIISENFLKTFKITLKMLNTRVTLTNQRFIKLLIDKKLNYHNYIDVDIWLNNDFYSKIYYDKSMLFRACENDNTFLSILKSNNFKTELLMVKENNKTLIEELFKMKCEKSLSFLMNLEIQITNQITENDLYKYLNEMPILLDTIIDNKKYNNIITNQVFKNLLLLSLKKNDLVNKSFNSLISSKFFSSEMLQEEFNGRSLLSHISKNQICFEHLLQNNMIPHKLLFTKDAYGDVLLLNIKHHFNDIENILKYIPWDVITDVNNYKQTFYHHFANDLSFKYLLNHKNFYGSILSQIDSFGKTCVDYIIEYNNIDNFELLLQNSNCISVLSNILLNKDNKYNTFGKLLKNMEDISNGSHNCEKELNKIVFNNKFLMEKDNYGITNFMQIVRYSSYILSSLINSETFKFDTKLLDTVDNNGFTVLMIASIYNIESFEILLNKFSDKFSIKHLIGNKYNGSCLTKLIKHNPQGIRFIINSKLMTNQLILSQEIDNINDYNTSLNVIQLACVYSSDALSFILNSEFDLTDLIFEIKGKKDNLFNALKLAITYQPDCIPLLLKSKYGSLDLLLDTEKLLNKNLLIGAFELQSNSCVKLIENKLIIDNPDKFLNSNILDQFTKSFPNVNIDNFNKLKTQYPLTKENDTFCSRKDPNVCNICVSKIKKVLFQPCNHTFCVGCSIRLKSCPNCRSSITDKIVFNKH